LKIAVRLLALFCVALALAGCGRSASYRYKLTLSVNTPDGEKTAFNVVQLDYREVSFPARGVAHNVHGQGLYIDLGAGRRPLIALLNHIRRADQRPVDIRWGEDTPGGVLARVCLGISGIHDVIEVMSQLASCNAPFPITPADLPDLVTFGDTDNPQSIVLVDPNNLSATLGEGVSWNAMTIQTTDEALTSDLTKRLPWLKSIVLFPKIPAINSFMQLRNGFFNRDFVRDGD